jgi:hypothetical protein
LNRQIAASDFSVLKETMMGCYLGSTMSVPGKFSIQVRWMLISKTIHTNVLL